MRGACRALARTARTRPNPIPVVSHGRLGGVGIARNDSLIDAGVGIIALLVLARLCVAKLTLREAARTDAVDPGGPGPFQRLEPLGPVLRQRFFQLERTVTP
jgi:hypothetical protein